MAAGIRRRMRRAKKSRSEMRPVSAPSRSSSPVMRKPETTKNTSTPTKPPLGSPTTWVAMTIPTASARSPWMSRRIGVRGEVGFEVTVSAEDGRRSV